MEARVPVREDAGRAVTDGNGMSLLGEKPGPSPSGVVGGDLQGQDGRVWHCSSLDESGDLGVDQFVRWIRMLGSSRRSACFCTSGGCFALIQVIATA